MITPQHTFILTPATWLAEGRYLDQAGQWLEVQGLAEVSHHQEVWINRASLRLKTGGPTIENVYRVRPFTLEEGFTFWESSNPELGLIHGRLAVIAETMLLTFATQDGLYTGAESLVFVHGSRYLNRGTLFKGSSRLSSWAVELARIS